MLRVNGFYGHVRRNDLRAIAMFAGFLLAFQLLAAVVLFVPLVFLDIGHALILDPLGYCTRYVPLVFAAGVFLFLKGFFRHIATVQTSVSFAFADRRTEPRLCRIVETLALGAGLPFPRVAIIETPARNAFACGISRSSAVVVVTRGLLDALDDDELAAVAAHEIAHIRNGDIRLLAAANVFMDNLALLRRGNFLRVKGPVGVIVSVLFPLFLYLVLAGNFVGRAALTLARLSRLLISSSREFVADAEAVRMTHNPAALISALRRIENRSAVPGLSPQADAMMIDGPAEGAFASHPTVAERIAVLARLSGDMVQFAGPRRDTRPMAQVLATRDAAFGRKAQAAPAAARNLIDRVTVDAAADGFGMSKRIRISLGIGFGLLMAMQFSVMFMNGLPAQEGAASADLSYDESGQIFLSKPAAGREAQRLAASDPSAARCFRTDAYGVGDRGLRKLDKLDPQLVERFSHGGADSGSDVVPEKYLGLRLRSIDQVVRARDENRDAALLAYAETRKTLLQVMHRFFGESGLRLMQEAYRGAEDRAILTTLRIRLKNPAPLLAADPRRQAELRLLVSAPEDFIPCLARARANEAAI